jgi:hypothetical protein
MSATADLVPRAECDWPTTNCYVDAWMPLLATWGLDPVAGLGITVTQDYEGDQFTFFKFLHEDLELLYGVVVGELSIYRSLEEQIKTQVGRGNVVLVEVDGYYLPDTRSTSYRTQHTKTTIAIDRIALGSGFGYFHNGGYHELHGDDYAGAVGPRSGQILPPYVEFVRRRFPPLRGAVLIETSVKLLRRQLGRRPDNNPIRQYRDDFPRHVALLITNPDRFHEYAFNNFRQLGANFELLARHIDWLRIHCQTDLSAASDAARAISAAAKALQFKVARIVSKGRFDACDSIFDTLEQSYTRVMAELNNALPPPALQRR